MILALDIMLQLLLENQLSSEVRQRYVKGKILLKKLKLNLTFRVSARSIITRSHLSLHLSHLSPIFAKRKQWHELCMKREAHSSQFIPFCSYLLLFQSKAHYGLIASFQSKHSLIQGFVWCLYFLEVLGLFFLLLLNALCVILGEIKKEIRFLC